MNKKAVYRILKGKRWFCHGRRCIPRPRVKGRIFISSHSNERWAVDLTHIYCGEDGWGHLVAVQATGELFLGKTNVDLHSASSGDGISAGHSNFAFAETA